MKSQYIGIDFDGTVVKYKYPEIGEVNPGAIECLLDLQAAGHKLILITMRSEDRLAEAVEYLENNGVKLYSVNENPSQKYWTKSNKIFANYYIDDAAIGVPLVSDTIGKPFVDWDEVRDLLEVRGLI